MKRIISWIAVETCTPRHWRSMTFLSAWNACGKTAGKARRALGTARDQLEALMKSASTGVPQPKSYHRGAFAAEAVPAIFIETLRALAETLEAVPDRAIRNGKRPCRGWSRISPFIASCRSAMPLTRPIERLSIRQPEGDSFLRRSIQASRPNAERSSYGGLLLCYSFSFRLLHRRAGRIS